MFDLGWTEIVVIAVVMILVVGPKELPVMLRTIGRAIASIRRMASDFQRQFNDALYDAEFDEIKNTIDHVKKRNPAQDFKKNFDPIAQALQDVETDLKTASVNAGTAIANSDTIEESAISSNTDTRKNTV